MWCLIEIFNNTTIQISQNNSKYIVYKHQSRGTMSDPYSTLMNKMTSINQILSANKKGGYFTKSRSHKKDGKFTKITKR